MEKIKETFMNTIYLIDASLESIASTFLVLGALLDNLFHIEKKMTKIYISTVM